MATSVGFNNEKAKEVDYENGAEEYGKAKKLTKQQKKDKKDHSRVKKGKNGEKIKLVKYHKPKGSMASFIVHAFLATLLFSIVSEMTYTSGFGSSRLLPYALGTGLATSAMFYWCMRTAGAHFNPISTLFQWVLQFGSVAPGITFISVLSLIATQMVAGIAAAGIVRGFRGENSCLGAPYVGHVWGGDHEEDEAQWRAFIATALGNSVLLGGWFAAEHGKKLQPLVVGILQTMLVFTFFWFGGAAFNPATNFGAYVVSQFAENCGGHDAWIFFLANIVGGILGTILIFTYRYLTNRFYWTGSKAASR